MNTHELDFLEQLAANATAGPWQPTLSWPYYVSQSLGGGQHQKITDDVYDSDDAAFIAAARTAVPALIARIRELEAIAQVHAGCSLDLAATELRVVGTDEATPAAVPVQYATGSQKEEIIRLLNHPVITRPEKTKGLLNINRLDEERAVAAIAKLRQAIDDRENGALSQA